jgi:hypothetical protein
VKRPSCWRREVARSTVATVCCHTHLIYIHTHKHIQHTDIYVYRPPGLSLCATPDRHQEELLLILAVSTELCCVGSSRCYWLQKRGGEGGRKGEESDEIEKKSLCSYCCCCVLVGRLRSARELDRMTLSPLCVSVSVCTRVGESLWIR